MNGKAWVGIVLAAVVGLMAGSQWASQEAGGTEAEVTALLEAQAAAWNAGDLDGFMAGYWDSEELTFYSSDGVEKGHRGLRERYRGKYGEDRKGMGRLTFSELTVRSLGGGRAAATGSYKLEWERQPSKEGLFTLVLERRPEGWRVVHDHTSEVKGK